MENLGVIFIQIKNILEKYSANFSARDEYVGSQAKTKKLDTTYMKKRKLAYLEKNLKQLI
ncbi:MAG: hypothetical protein ACFFA2_13965 [Promethearchaeota archaeon]